MANPAGIPGGAAPIQQLNFSSGSGGAFSETLMNLIINNQSGAAGQVNCYLALDGVECGTWPLAVPVGYSNSLLCLRIPNLSAGGHYFVNYLYASASGINIYSSEIGVKIIKV